MKKKLKCAVLAITSILIIVIMMEKYGRTTYAFEASCSGTVTIESETGPKGSNGYFNKDSIFKLTYGPLQPIHATADVEYIANKDSLSMFIYEKPSPGSLAYWSEVTEGAYDLTTLKEVTGDKQVYEHLTYEQLQKYPYIATLTSERPKIYRNICRYQKVTLPLIDQTPPAIKNVISTPQNMYGDFYESQRITVEAEDTEGGLAKKPYSFDGGKTWSDKAVINVRKNGVLTIAVKDALDNISYQTVEVSGIDEQPPVLDKIQLQPDNLVNGYGKYAKLKVVAHDNETMLAKEPYSTDDGETFTADDEIVVQENGTISIMIKDICQNILEALTEITVIDKEGPELVSVNHIMPISANGYCQRVNVKLLLNDEKSGLAEYPVSWDDGNSYTKEIEKVFYDNEECTVFYKDALGNITQDTLMINCIDREKPVIKNLLVSPLNGVRGFGREAVVLVDAYDQKSGIHNQGYTMDGGITWQEKKQFVIRENGEYEIRVRDGLLNWDKESVSINCIDREGPVITNTDFKIHSAAKYGTKGELTVTATDSKSGLHEKPYSFDGGKTYISQNMTTVSENGVYLLCVRDALGNVSNKTIEVNSIDKAAPSVIISGNPSSDVDRDVTLTLTATDGQSGLASSWYQNDEIKAKSRIGTYKGENLIREKITIPTNGVYRFFFYDILGNCSEQVVAVTHINRNGSSKKSSSSSSVKKSSSSSSSKTKTDSEIQDAIIIGREDNDKKSSSVKKVFQEITIEEDDLEETEEIRKSVSGETVFVGLGDNEADSLEDIETEEEALEDRDIIEQELQQYMQQPAEDTVEIEYPELKEEDSKKGKILWTAFFLILILSGITILVFWKLGILHREDTEEDSETLDTE